MEAEAGLFSGKIQLPPAPNVEHADSTNSGLVVNGTGLTGTTFTQSVTISGINQVHVIEYTDNGTSKRLEVTPTATPYNISLSGADITSVAMYPKSALSRQDLVFLESWDEDISEKGNFIYPYGNVQYRGGNVDGLTGIADGSFTGVDTYSLFGNWQTAGDLVGKGYDWDTLTDAQKAIFAGNPENNLRKDGDKILQTQYKIRVEQGLDDSPSITDYGYVQVDTDKGLYYNATTGKYGVEIAAVQRRNQGAFHPLFNPFGCNTWENTGGAGHRMWYHSDFSTTPFANNTISCFAPTDGTHAGSYETDGKISSTYSGRPDGKFYDAVYSSDIIDLRNSAHDKPKAELLEDIKRSLISGEKRSDFDGDGVWETTALPVAPYQRWIEDGVVASYLQQSTHKQSGQKLHCDIIGDPANYPQAWKDALANGYTLMGTPLLVGENGEDYTGETDRPLSTNGTGANDPAWAVKLSNKAIVKSQCIVSADSGTNWKSLAHIEVGTGGITEVRGVVSGYEDRYSHNYVTNELAIAEEDSPRLTGIALVFYTTTDNPTYPAVNSECLEIGDVAALSNNQVDKGNALLTALINKVGVSTDDYEQLLAENISVNSDGEIISQPKHATISLAESDVQAKVLFTVGSENGRYVVYAHFKEIKFDTSVSGDDSLFQMLDNVTTSTDDNGATVLTGTKAIKTNYFVKEK
jgi:hypothetical protein